MPGPLLAGSPIRRPAGRRVCAPNRGLSQLAASFVGFPCQGIRRAPCISSHMSRSRSVSTGPTRGPGQNHTARGASAPGAIVVSMSTAPSDRGTLSCGHVSQNRLDDFRDDSHLARPAPDLVGGGPGRLLPARLAMRLSRYAGIPRGPGTAGGAADGRTGRVLRLKKCLPIPGSSSP